jgi:hypothetical protein
MTGVSAMKGVEDDAVTLNTSIASTTTLVGFEHGRSRRRQQPSLGALAARPLARETDYSLITSYFVRLLLFVGLGDQLPVHLAGVIVGLASIR